jgi:two-component system, OmpR family, response regulator
MRVLVVEDEPRLAELIRRVLNQERFEADVCFDGVTGFDAASTGAYDVVVLDRMLPGMDGVDLLQALRRVGNSTPVLMLTALGDVPERIEGLEAGADDYLGKPFAFEELIARIRVLGRRSSHDFVPEVFVLGNVKVDLNQRIVTREECLIDLSPTEFGLLEFLLRNRGRILSRDQLLERVWGYDADPKGNVVELYIHYLRRKLDPSHVNDPPLIRTVRGVGYMIAAD